MVSLKQIGQANRSRSCGPKTAVFAGATSGIGLGVMEALLKYVKGCKVFVIGRSEKKFAPTLARLEALDPTATISFLEAQVSLLCEIDRICSSISQEVNTLDVLWLSQGGLGLRENDGFNNEGLPLDFAVSYYGRLLFMQKLAPLLSKSTNGRVVSVLSAGMEGPVNVADPGLAQPENYAAAGFWGAQKHGVTMQSLAMEHLASQYQGITLIHTNPGPVSTDVHAKWAKSFTGVWKPIAWLIEFVMMPLFALAGYSTEQAGETGLFEALDDRFDRDVAKNFFRVDDHAEVIRGRGARMLTEYRENGTAEKIWEHTQGVFERVLGSS